jgi:hypothetical protein
MVSIFGVLPILVKPVAFPWKPMLHMINIWHKMAVFLVINTNFSPFFEKNVSKNHNTGPWIVTISKFD